MNKVVVSVVVVAVILIGLPVVVQQLQSTSLVGSRWEGKLPGISKNELSMTVEFLENGRLILKVDMNIPGAQLPPGFEVPEIAGSWTREEGRVTVTVAGQSSTGTLTDDVIIFRDSKMSLRRLTE